MKRVASGWCFSCVDDPEALRERLASALAGSGLLGTIILAAEGINLALHGEAGALDAAEALLRAEPPFAALSLHRSDDFGRLPFRRLRVVVRAEIVSLGQPVAADAHGAARRLDPDAWDAMLAAGDVPVVDLRNRYEVETGTFPEALDPGTEGFREAAAWLEETFPDRRAPVAMFCTGGIRCAKAAAWMRTQGWEDVRELDGGLLAYLDARGAEDSRFLGECFLFDDRVSVGPGGVQGDAEVCHGCRRPVTSADRAHPAYEPGVSCRRCRATASADELDARRERRRQVELARARGDAHLAP